MKSLLFQWALALLLPVGLLAQNPKTKATTTKAPAPAATANDQKMDVEAFRELKNEMEKQRTLGKSNTEIVRSLKGQKGSNNKMISQRDLLRGLRKTTTVATFQFVAPPSSNASPTAPPVAPSPVVAPPTTPVETGLSEEIMNDAVEIVQCFAPLNPDGFLTAEDILMIAEEFQIPRLSVFLQILDRAGEFDETNHIASYAHLVDRALFIETRSESPVLGLRSEWTRLNPFVSIYFEKGVPAKSVFWTFEAAGRSRDAGFQNFFSRSMDAVFTGNVLIAAISSVYHIAGNDLLRQLIESDRRNTPDNPLERTVRRFGGIHVSGSVDSWATILKSDTAPNGTDGTFPSVSSADATRFLVAAGYSRESVMEAVRRVYQN